MKHLPAIGVLLVLVFVEFRAVVDFQYTNWDDDQYVTENAQVAAGLTWNNVVWAFRGPHVGNWHPLATLSHLIDVELFGLDPRIPHVENVLFHAINALLVYGVWLAMGGNQSKALAVAALFAVHPLRIESVAWVTERKDVLCAMFWLLAMAAYLRYAALPTAARYALVTLCVVAAMLSKPMAVTLPVALLLIDFFWTPTHIAARPIVLEKLPWFAMSLAVAAITFVQQSEFGGTRSLTEIPLWARICNAEVSYLVYLKQMFWPVGLACYYPYPITPSTQPMPRYLFLAQGGAALAVLVAITWLVVRARSKAPYLLFGWLWYLVTLLPVIGLAQAGLQAHADRFTYLPSLGITTAVVWGVSDLLRRAWPADASRQMAVGGMLVGIAVALCLIVDRPAVLVWRDTETLFRRAIDVAPSAVSHFHLGLHFDRTGRKVAALDEYRFSLALDPRDAKTHNNLAALLWLDGRRDEALAEYRKAIKLDSRLAIAQENFGEALLELGETSDAMAHLTKAVDLAPDSARARYHLGRARAILGQTRLAEDEFRDALRFKPDWPEAHNNLGAVLMQQGRFDEAKKQFDVALQLDSSLIDASINRAIVLADTKQLDAAREDFNRALRTPGLDTSTRDHIIELMHRYDLEDQPE